MPVNSFSVGRDFKVDIFDNNSRSILQFSNLTSFDVKQESKSEKSVGLDGINRHMELYEGWSGSFSIDREDNTIDDFFAMLENMYYTGQNIQPAVITETITEPTGNISQYRYEGVVFKYSDAGKRDGNAKVSQKIDFKASRRRKIV